MTSGLDFPGRENLLDPDTIARRLSPSNPRRAAIASGREVVRRIQNYLGSRVSFAIETTRAGGLSRICLDTPERSILRVNERVLQGGHDVSDQDVRRRYLRSLARRLPAV
jgi:predicted ABC-type ATPase